MLRILISAVCQAVTHIDGTRDYGLHRNCPLQHWRLNNIREGAIQLTGLGPQKPPIKDF